MRFAYLPLYDEFSVLRVEYGVRSILATTQALAAHAYSTLRLDPGFPAGMAGGAQLAVVLVSHFRHSARDWRKPVARDGNQSGFQQRRPG